MSTVISTAAELQVDMYALRCPACWERDEMTGCGPAHLHWLAWSVLNRILTVLEPRCLQGDYLCSRLPKPHHLQACNR